MIIDGHCHAGRGDALTARGSPTARSAPGIDRTVVFAVFHSDYRVANAEVAEIVASDESLVGFACVHARAVWPSSSAARSASGVSGV